REGLERELEVDDEQVVVAVLVQRLARIELQQRLVWRGIPLAQPEAVGYRLDIAPDVDQVLEVDGYAGFQKRTRKGLGQRLLASDRTSGLLQLGDLEMLTHDRFGLALGDVPNRVPLGRVQLESIGNVPHAVARRIELLQDAKARCQLQVDIGPWAYAFGRRQHRLAHQPEPFPGPRRDEGIGVIRRKQVPAFVVVRVRQDDVRELHRLVDAIGERNLEWDRPQHRGHRLAVVAVHHQVRATVQQ